MTQRAKRLGQFLERCGWTVFEKQLLCKSCGHKDYDCSFCKMCGHKMTKNINQLNALDQLEAGIAYALKE